LRWPESDLECGCSGEPNTAIFLNLLNYPGQGKPQEAGGKSQRHAEGVYKIFQSGGVYVEARRARGWSRSPTQKRK